MQRIWPKSGAFCCTWSPLVLKIGSCAIADFSQGCLNLWIRKKGKVLFQWKITFTYTFRICSSLLISPLPQKQTVVCLPCQRSLDNDLSDMWHENDQNEVSPHWTTLSLASLVSQLRHEIYRSIVASETESRYNMTMSTSGFASWLPLISLSHHSHLNIIANQIWDPSITSLPRNRRC